jgi:L-threonylcarbamoyladenylate synthase
LALLLNASAQAVASAAAQLARGGLLGLPTETVYGLAADADNPRAVHAIFAAKGRPADHPLIVHLAPPAEGEDWARVLSRWASEVPPMALALAQAFWPGPLTMVLRRQDGVGAAAAGGLPTLALRCPAHPVALAVLQAAQAMGVHGVAAPSANRFGRVSPTTAAHVMHEFADSLSDQALLVIDGGACDVGIESTIVDCSREYPVLLRPGMISASRLSAVLGQAVLPPDAQAPKVSGTLASHYAPRATVRLMAAREVASAWAALPDPERPHVAVYAPGACGLAGLVHGHDMPGDAAACAHELFAVLRALDGPEVHTIWVAQPDACADWAGVADRLQRAAA